MARRSKPKQMMLGIRKYVVRGDGLGDLEVQAASPSAAKWSVFKRWRDGGWLTESFRDFLRRGVTARELGRV